MLAELLFRPFELLLNRGLRQSTSAQGLAARLEGRTLGLAIEGTPLDLRICVAGSRLAVVLPDGSAPDACIAGTVLSLARLLRADPASAIREGDVRMSGDTEIAEDFRELLRFVLPDPEEELSRIVGDPLARHAGNAARAFAGWSSGAASGIARNVSEYLQEESRVAPAPSEAREFARDVDELVNDVARAEARLRRLKDSL